MNLNFILTFRSKGYNLMTSYDRFPKEKYLQSKTVMLFEKARPRDSGRYECKIKTTKGILNRTFDIPPTKGNFSLLE